MNDKIVGVVMAARGSLTLAMLSRLGAFGGRASHDACAAAADLTC